MPISTSRAAVVLALLASSSCAFEGCTALGFVIGSALPSYEDVSAKSLVEVPSGVELKVESAGKEYKGQYRGVHDGSLELGQPRGTSQLLPLAGSRVSRREGNHATEGLVVGFCVDAVLLAVLVASGPFGIPAFPVLGAQ